MPAFPPAAGRVLSVAPMMDCTDRHARFLLRLITRRTWLYTEMVHAQAALRAPQRTLGYAPAEHPLALQLGGSDPDTLAAAARLGVEFGYAEINLNVGCPSPRVQEGRFGACLMAEPARVAECVAAMTAAAAVPVTVKCRTGLGREEGGAQLDALVDAVAGAGCCTFVVHARNAWLDGLSPRENRTVPPLRYALVHALKVRRPELTVILNGGIGTLAQAREQLDRVDGVMVGRAAYHAPYRLAQADALLWGDPAPAPSRAQVLERYLEYACRERAAGVPGTVLLKPLQGLYEGQPGARAWRAALGRAAASGDWRALGGYAAAA